MISIEDPNHPTIETSTEAIKTCAAVKETLENGKVVSYADFDVPAGFKGQLNAYVEDNVGNVSATDIHNLNTWMHPDDFILETLQQHNQENINHPHVQIIPRSTSVGEIDNAPLYNGVFVKLKVQ